MDYRELRERTQELMLANQFARAEVLVRQLLTHSPRDTQLWIRHGDVLQRLGRPADAAQAYRTAAHLFSSVGHLGRAVAALKMALKLLPDDVDLISDIIRIELKRGPAAYLAALGVSPSSIRRSVEPATPSPVPALPMLTTTPAPFPEPAPSVPTTHRPASTAPRASDDVWAEPPGMMKRQLAADAHRASEPSRSTRSGLHAPSQPRAGGDSHEESPPEQPGTWPIIRRLDARRVAIQPYPTARWLLLQSISDVALFSSDDPPTE